ncbi:MAG TPA: 16S rRNA (cytidine(1402)-2'-O)-methyltransferase [Gemmatimonadaceae bacterium]|nr:16S rRNA (cytidine(1402)-2'-O)-methyltransferase [Gemmatimonadaceae bacterium]
MVSTPIGNLGDISFRAVEVLKSVALILAEDTRHSRHLLDHYGIATPTSAYHEHNEARATAKILERLAEGQDVALISDAGTPLLSDPGARLVAGAIEAGVEVVAIPGASALLAALASAGLGAERFTFFGFLERKGRERSDAVAEIVTTPHTCVLYEAPGRVGATLRDLAAAGGGERVCAVARELTKKFEEIRRGTIAELADLYGEEGPRGEVVIVVGPKEKGEVDEAELTKVAEAMKAEGKAPREIVARLGAMGASRNIAYRLGHEKAP